MLDGISASVLPAMEIGDEPPTALYRLFNAEGGLLYVGIGDLKARLTAHAREKPWWPEVARKTVEWHPSRSEAEIAELLAIRTEHPLYNVAGTKAARDGHGSTGAPFAPPGHVPDPARHVDRIRELLMADVSHAEFVLRVAAVLMCGDRVPRGAKLDQLAKACGVSRRHAYRILAEQDASDEAMVAQRLWR